MTDLKTKLVECFAVVFPNRPPEALLTANRESFEEWDSLAGLTLLAVLQEQFEIEIDPMDLEQLSSFPRIQTYLDRRLPAQRG